MKNITGVSLKNAKKLWGKAKDENFKQFFLFQGDLWLTDGVAMMKFPMSDLSEEERKYSGVLPTSFFDESLFNFHGVGRYPWKKVEIKISSEKILLFHGKKELLSLDRKVYEVKIPNFANGVSNIIKEGAKMGNSFTVNLLELKKAFNAVPYDFEFGQFRSYSVPHLSNYISYVYSVRPKDADKQKEITVYMAGTLQNSEKEN